MTVPLLEVSSCTSTQDLVTALLDEHPNLLAVALRADHQRNGRGREDRSWYDSGQPGEHLLLSIAVRGPFHAWALDGLTVDMAGIAAELLHDVAPKMPVTIKAPNDLYVDDRKLGGILVDAVTVGDRVRRLVVGIGINLRGERKEHDGRAATTILAEAPRASIGAADLAQQLADEIVKHLNRYR